MFATGNDDKWQFAAEFSRRVWPGCNTGLAICFVSPAPVYYESARFAP